MSEEKARYDVPYSVATLVGHIDIIKRVPSRMVTQVVIEIPSESFKDAVAHFDNEMVFVQVVSKDMKDIPYGVHKHIEDVEPVKVDAGQEKPAATEIPEKQPSTGRVGKACFEAIQFCQDENFQTFMVEVKDAADIGEAACKDEFIVRCGVDSRKELDTNKEAHKVAQSIYREFINWNTKR